MRSSAEDAPGLPIRAELQKWIAEHDMIEKETEIFDTGELTKLRQLTKGTSLFIYPISNLDIVAQLLHNEIFLPKILTSSN